MSRTHKDITYRASRKKGIRWVYSQCRGVGHFIKRALHHKRKTLATGTYQDITDHRTLKYGEVDHWHHC